MTKLSNIMAAKATGRIANATRSRDEANSIYRRALHGRHETRFDAAVADGKIEAWTRNGGLYDITLPGGITMTLDPLASWAALDVADALNVDQDIVEALTA